MNISNYLKEISKYPLLDKESEIKYTVAAKDGDPYAKEMLVTSNLRLVVSIAKRYTNVGVPLLDLIQEGNIGLMKAVDKFNPDLKKRFSTYATFWIKQRILRYISTNKGVVRYPTYIYDNISKINKFTQKYLNLYNSHPAPAIIAKELEMKLTDVVKYQSIYELTLNSLEDGYKDTNDLHNIISDSFELEDSLIQKFTNEELFHCLNCLSSNEQKVIISRFGLFNATSKTLEEIGSDLDLTRERIRQIQIKAIGKLKDNMVNSH